MNVYISLDGVLRNTIEKLEYHYNDYYIESDAEVDESFCYSVTTPITNENLLKHFAFQSLEEFEHFLFVEFPLEIFGHAKPSYPAVFNDLNKLIFDNPDINFTIVGLDEKSKARPASLFFLSKNNFLGYNIKFISSKKLKSEWKKCNLWITDNSEIIKLCPNNKKAIKFSTIFNEHITNKLQINNLTQIETTWLKFSENSISSTLTQLLTPAKPIKIKDDEGNETFEINIFKYELLKLCVERLLGEFEPNDEKITAFEQNDLSISFKFSFNTLLKNNIITEDDTDE